MITAFTYCGKFENFTFCIEPLSLHFIVTLPVFNVLSIFPIVPVENVEPPNNANGAYDMSLHPSLFIEIVTDFISAPEVLYINKLLKTFLLFYQMIIAELFPLKFKVTFPVSRLTLPVIDVSEAPHRDFISI